MPASSPVPANVGATALLAVQTLAEGQPAIQRTRQKASSQLSGSTSSPALLSVERQPSSRGEGLSQKTKPEVDPEPPSSPPAAALSPEPPRVCGGRSPLSASASTAARQRPGLYPSRDLEELKATFSGKGVSDPFEARRRDGKSKLGSIELPKLPPLLQEEDLLNEHRMRRELGKVLSFTKREPSPAPFLRGAALGHGSATLKS